MRILATMGNDGAQAEAPETLADEEHSPLASPTLTVSQPKLYEVDGRMMTFVEQADYFRAAWEVNGYPPGVE